MALLNNQATLDSRKLLTGKDGQLFVEDPNTGDMIFLAEVNTFTVAMNVTNADYQPCGTSLSYGVPATHTFSLTYTEAVIRDDLTMQPILDMIKNGENPNFTFQGAVKRAMDGQETRVILRNTIPDGTFNLLNIVPGEVLQRETTWRVNSFPEYQSYFAA